MTHNTPQERYIAELRDLRAFSANESYRHALDYAIAVLTSREAGEGEVVAWACWSDAGLHRLCIDLAEARRQTHGRDWRILPLYAAPPPVAGELTEDDKHALNTVATMAWSSASGGYEAAQAAYEHFKCRLKATPAPPPPVDGKWAKVRQWAAQAQRGEMNDAAFVFNVSFLAAAPVAAGGWPTTQPSYTALFNAIAAATKPEGGSAGVSVRAFLASLAAAPQRLSDLPPVAAAQPDEAVDDAMVERAYTYGLRHHPYYAPTSRGDWRNLLTAALHPTSGTT